MSKTKQSLDKVLANLNKAINQIQGGTLEGVRAATLFIEAESVERTPIEFGVLRNSAYSDAEKQRDKIVGRVGYTAEYAPIVHELPMKLRGQPRSGKGRGVYWQGGENKFLQKAITNNLGTILKIIADRAKF